jgi:hypothetical protein
VAGRLRFNPSRAAKNLIQPEEIADSSRANAAIIQAANHIKETFLLRSPSGPMKVGKIAQRNKLFSAENLLDFFDAEEQQKRAEEEEKAQKREERERKKRKREEDKLMLVEANKAKKEAKLKASETRRCGECAKVFRHQKTWWLCSQCKLYRLCTDHSTDGVSILEHEGECAQAIENTPQSRSFQSHTVGAL